MRRSPNLIYKMADLGNYTMFNNQPSDRFKGITDVSSVGFLNNNFIPESRFSGEPTVKSGKALSNVWINNWIKSSNFKPRKSGYSLDAKTGTIETRELKAVNIKMTVPTSLGSGEAVGSGLYGTFEWFNGPDVIALMEAYGGGTNQLTIRTHNEDNRAAEAYVILVQLANQSAVNILATSSAITTGIAQIILSQENFYYDGDGNNRDGMLAHFITRHNAGATYGASAFEGHVLPYYNGFYDLGNADRKWNKIYGEAIYGENIYGDYIRTTAGPIAIQTSGGVNIIGDSTAGIIAETVVLKNLSSDPTAGAYGALVLVLGVLKLCTSVSPLTWTVVGTQT